jgi:hypothetical protein
MKAWTVAVIPTRFGTTIVNEPHETPYCLFCGSSLTKAAAITLYERLRDSDSLDEFFERCLHCNVPTAES